MKSGIMQAHNPLIQNLCYDCELRGMTPESIRRYKSSLLILSRFLHSDKVNIDAISMPLLKDFLECILHEPHVKHKTAKNYSALSTFYEYLACEGRVETTIVLPFRRRYLKRYKSNYDASERKLLDVTEMSKLVASILDPRDKAIAVLLAKTGIRRGELLRLDVGDIRWEDCSIKLKPTPKRSNRVVFFDDECLITLKRWLRIREKLNPQNKALFLSYQSLNRLDRNSLYMIIVKYARRLGSWLNAEYGKPLKTWFLNNCKIEYIIESLVERWFEDAKIITNIIVAEKSVKSDFVTNFLFLKKSLKELFGATPPAGDLSANQRYFEQMTELLSVAKNVDKDDGYAVYDNERMRIVTVRKGLLQSIESKLGKWGILRGPEEYLKILFEHMRSGSPSLVMVDKVLDLKRGLTTNANEIFYLPSKHWRSLDEDEEYITLGGPTHSSLKVSKNIHLRPLIRTAHIQDSPYRFSSHKKKRYEDYVLWVDDSSDTRNHAMSEYLEWAKDLLRKGYRETGKFSTIVKNLDSPTWAKLPDTSGRSFLLKNAIHRNYSILSNGMKKAQVDLRLYVGQPKPEFSRVDHRIIFASLNSVTTYLGMELMGRTNLGEGALDIKTSDYKQIPIVNPAQLEEFLRDNGNLQEFLELADQLLMERPLNIEGEINNEIRMKMENHIFDATCARKGVARKLYKDLLELANLRADRATSLKKKI